MSNISIAIIFLLLIVFGFVAESLYFQNRILAKNKKLKTYHFNTGRYIYYLITPVTALTFAFIATTSIKLLYVFFVFSLLGTFLEWLAGFAYHMIVGQKLWTYHRYSIGGYTSLLSMPLWGIGGVLFWLLVQIFI